MNNFDEGTTFDSSGEMIDDEEEEYSSSISRSSRSDSNSSSIGSSSDDDSSSGGDDDIMDDYESEGEADAAYEAYGELMGHEDELFVSMNNTINDDNSDTIERQVTIRRQVIVLALPILLIILLTNFAYAGYQLLQLSKDSNDKSIVDKNNNDNDATSTTRYQQFYPANVQEKVYTHNAQDIDDYQLPKHPERIYKHASLSSKNYRAGGILSDEMLHRYEEDGVLVIRNLISPKLLDRLDTASQMLINNGKDRTRKRKQFHMVKNGAIFLGIPSSTNENDDNKVCGSEDASCEAKADKSTEDDNNIILSSFRDLAMYSKIPRVAASLLRLDELRVGGEDNLKHKKRRRQHEEEDVTIDDSINLRISRDIFLTKDDDDYACGWHVDDTGFWPNVASDPGVNAWIALDDMPWEITSSSDSSMTTAADKKTQKCDPVATFALSLGSHRSSWRHEAYDVTGSTHTNPPEGYKSAADLIQRRRGSGTCNIESSAPNLYEKLEQNKVIYDLKKGDVIFHDRWLFHRTVTVGEYDKMTREKSGEQQHEEKKIQTDKIFKRYSIRYAPGSSRIPPGYGVELSVLHDETNANKTLDTIVEKSGSPWYPKVWPHVLKTKPISSKTADEEEIEGITDLVHNKIPRAEVLQKERKKEIQRLLQRG